MSTKDEEGRPLRGNILGENSVIRVGFALGIGTYIGMTAWWAAVIQTKLDALLTAQKIYASDGTALRARVEALERSTELFTQVGSPALRPRIESLEKSVQIINAAGSPKLSEVEHHLSDLEQSFKVHVAETVNGKKVP